MSDCVNIPTRTVFTTTTETSEESVTRTSTSFSTGPPTTTTFTTFFCKQQIITREELLEQREKEVREREERERRERQKREEAKRQIVCPAGSTVTSSTRVTVIPGDVFTMPFQVVLTIPVLATETLAVQTLFSASCESAPPSVPSRTSTTHTTTHTTPLETHDSTTHSDDPASKTASSTKSTLPPTVVTTASLQTLSNGSMSTVPVLLTFTPTPTPDPTQTSISSPHHSNKAVAIGVGSGIGALALLFFLGYGAYHFYKKAHKDDYQYHHQVQNLDDPSPDPEKYTAAGDAYFSGIHGGASGAGASGAGAGAGGHGAAAGGHAAAQGGVSGAHTAPNVVNFTHPALTGAEGGAAGHGAPLGAHGVGANFATSGTVAPGSAPMGGPMVSTLVPGPPPILGAIGAVGAVPGAAIPVIIARRRSVDEEMENAGKVKRNKNGDIDLDDYFDPYDGYAPAASASASPDVARSHASVESGGGYSYAPLSTYSPSIPPPTNASVSGDHEGSVTSHGHSQDGRRNFFVVNNEPNAYD